MLRKASCDLDKKRRNVETWEDDGCTKNQERKVHVKIGPGPTTLAVTEGARELQHRCELSLTLWRERGPEEV